MEDFTGSLIVSYNIKKNILHFYIGNNIKLRKPPYKKWFKLLESEITIKNDSESLSQEFIAQQIIIALNNKLSKVEMRLNGRN